MKQVFALVDCNNFFASCERIFRPDLTHTPVLVLSSNDGCVIARSQEVKTLGIPMGSPLFTIKDLVQKYNIEVFSSNFSLYSDISRRFSGIMATFSQEMEIYSVDEVFLKFSDVKEDYMSLGHLMKHTMLKNLSLPLSIGFSYSKTLSKVANYWAKNDPSRKGVCVLLSSSDILNALENLPLQEVWGIGRKLSSKLKSLGLKSALDLANSDLKQMRQMHSVLLEKTILELRGESCISLESSPPPPKSIQVSRSFGKTLSTRDDIESALSTFSEKASKKLRSKNLYAYGLHAYLGARIGSKGRMSFFSKFLEFPEGVQDPRSIIKSISNNFNFIFKNGISYSKAGIILVELGHAKRQFSLLETSHKSSQLDASLFKAIDHLQRKFGEDSIRLGSSFSSVWKPKSQKLSPSYTTKWNDLPIVKAI